MNDVCRLCLREEDLIWIFDKRLDNRDNMKEVIRITTGVEISTKDIVSQKICQTCCAVTIKMFEFRRTSLRNDRLLRERFKAVLKDREIKIPNTEVTIRSELKSNSTDSDKTDSNKNTTPVKKENKSVYKVHPTVRALFNMYPEIKLSTGCLKYDIAPCVSMKMDQVEQYFKSHNLDFEQHTKLALKAGRVATKKTSGLIKPKNNIPSTAATYELKISATQLIEKFLLSNGGASMPSKIHPASPETSTSSSSITSISPGNSAKKRKLSDVEVECVEKKGKMNFMQPLNSTTGNMPRDESSCASNTSEVLHICDICSTVKYSANDLKKHRSRHMRCHLCKMRFKNMQLKNEHLDKTCSIKNTMKNLPCVYLKRIELDVDVRRTYPDAFEGFPPLKTTAEINIENINEIECKESKQVQDQSVQPVEIIEIVSDEDEAPPLSSATVDIPLPPIIPLQSTVSAQPTPVNVTYNTVSIVKPGIKIKGNSALDLIDVRLNDTIILKQLLSNNQPAYTTAEKWVQTDWPTSEMIRLNRFEKSAELKQLKPQLHVYKIPVFLKCGPFAVTYNYSAGEVPTPKQQCLWNDLKPIDVKPTTVQVTNEDLQKMTILPSPVTELINQSPQSISISTSTSKYIRISTSLLSPITTLGNVINTNTVQDATLSTVQASDNIPVTTQTQTLNVDASPTTAVATQQMGVIRVKDVRELI